MRFTSALMATAAMAVGGLFLVNGISTAAQNNAAQSDADYIGGTVVGPKGAEAGVWVIAETKDLPTKYVKIVVTDEQGRFVIPDLPQAKYKVWVRGYGLVDSKPVDSAPGKRLELKATSAPDEKTAAQIYPASYWWSIMKMPDPKEFPGTGPGNGIATGITTQQGWTNTLKRCLVCHQQGTPITRGPVDPSVEGWQTRIQQFRPDDDPALGDHGRGYTQAMVNTMSSFGPRGINLWSDWTQRVAKGELPSTKPPRPEGIERNVVLTLTDWGDSTFIHDEVSSDRRNPMANANGPVYGIGQNTGKLAIYDPKTHTSSIVDIPGGAHRNAHTLALDTAGHVWFAELGRYLNTSIPAHERPAFCTDGTKSKFAKYFPAPGEGREVGMYDPATKKIDEVDVCFGSQHLVMDKDDKMFFTIGGPVLGWVDTKIWAQTHDAQKADGWCPLVIDTNGDGKITPDRTQWNDPKSGAPIDPKKDTLLQPVTYGLEANLNDGSIWYAGSSYPGVLTRFEIGANPPETCKGEVYNPPKGADGNYLAYGPRGVSIDSQGVAWIAFNSGQLGSFDRKKCKVLNGPTATGDQCPEGWTIYNQPNIPKFGGSNAPWAVTDWFYGATVDLSDVLGLGKDTIVLPGSNSDALKAYVQKTGKWVTLRVPYPLSFYTRWSDARIDDPNTGWKGKGFYATNSIIPIWHEETGEGGSNELVHFQIRPTPLTH